jgi:hypothetical protein
MLIKRQNGPFNYPQYDIGSRMHGISLNFVVEVSFGAPAAVPCLSVNILRLASNLTREM